MKAAEDVINN